MNPTKIRITIFSIWASVYFICFLLFLIAPLYRGAILFPPYLSQEGLAKLSCLYIPVLVAFAVFWFRDNAKGRKIDISNEQSWMSIVVTGLCNLMIFICVFYVTLIAPLGDANDVTELNATAEHLLNGLVFYMVHTLAAFAAMPLALFWKP